MPVDIEKIIQQVKPIDGEDQPSFAMRFHAGLTRAIPKTTERNAAMFRAWGTDPLSIQAQQHYPSDKYFRVEHVPEFAEHEAINSDGTKSFYGPDQLAAMVRNLNRRIEDTGNYSVLTDGHTPDDASEQQPDVVGHAGPFYLGQVGNLNPRWAIFADEHHRLDEKSRVERHPNRSPEIWRAERVEDRILDPIAVLGAETPRLDIGMVRYSVRTFAPRTGGVERYDVSCLAGPNNVYVPSFGETKKKRPEPKADKYAAEDENMPHEMDEASVAKIVKDVVTAITSLPEMVALQSLHASGKLSQLAGGDDDADATADPDADAMAGDAMAGDAMAGDDMAGDDMAGDDMGDNQDDDAPDFGDTGDADADADQPDEPVDEQSDDMSDMGDADEQGVDKPRSAPVEKIGATDDMPDDADAPTSDPALVAKVKELEAKIAALEAKLSKGSAEQYRRKTLTQLASSGIQMDVANELNMTRDFNRDQFERYAKNIEKTRVRVPLASVMGNLQPQKSRKAEPAGQPIGANHPDVEKYSKAAGTKAMKEGRSFEEVFREMAPKNVQKAVGM